MSYQIVIIEGNVGRDPEVRTTANGRNVASFSVAVTRKYTSSAGEPASETTWFRVSCWGKLADTAAKYVKKGTRVLVEGRMAPDPVTGTPRVYTRNDGSFGANYDITANSFQLLGGNSQSASAAPAGQRANNFTPPPSPNQAQGGYYNQAPGNYEFDDFPGDDIPF